MPHVIFLSDNCHVLRLKYLRIQFMSNSGSKYLQLIGIAAQMGGTIFLGAYFGKMLDEKYPSGKKWFTMGLTLLAIFVALYMVLRQLKKINETED